MLNCRKECLAKSGSTQISCGSGGDSALNLKKTHIRVESAIVEKNNSGNRTTMKKTLTAAVALSAIAGLALATIETPAAGYVDVETSAFVLNPFTAFDGALSLGDIEGTDGAVLRVIYPNGKKAFEVAWDSAANPAGWYDGAGCSNAFALVRGQSVQFISDNDTLTMAGVLTNSNASVTCVAGHNFVGNVAPVAVSLTSVSIANFDADSGDYAFVDGSKYAYYGGNWYGFNEFRAAASVSSLTPVANNAITIAPGTGFRVFCSTRRGSKPYPVITLAGSVN